MKVNKSFHRISGAFFVTPLFDLVASV